MSHDPFDRLRAANPAPDESLPAAPMSTAERIVAARRRIPWPGWTVAATAALAALVVGGGWMLWLGSGDGTIGVADSSSTTAATTTATTIPVPENQATTVYLLSGTEHGTAVVPVPRTIETTTPVAESAEDQASAGAAWALEALLQPTAPAEEQRALWTAIPEGIDGPPPSVGSVAGGVATVAVPQQWVDLGYPTPEGLAQIVFTLTRIEGIEGVAFVLGDGEVAGGVVAGSMVLIPKDEFADHPFVDEVATRLTFEGYMSLAFIDRPAAGATVTLPLDLAGVTNSVGNQVRLTLEVDEQTLWQETVTATCGTPWSECRGAWDWSIWQTTIPDIGYEGGGAVLIAEAFGSGIEVIDRVTYPLTITFPGTTTTTTLPAATTTTLPPGEVPSALAVYLLMDADATHLSPGPHLVAAAWPTAILSAPLTDPPRQAMEWLLRGVLPGWEESVPSVTTAIPDGTRLLGLDVGDGVATVNLSEEFAPSVAAVGQVVYTLTRFDEIDQVRVLVGGEPVIAFADGGIVEALTPFTRDMFDGLLPPIMIETPLYGSFGTPSPLVASGTADVFEGTVSLALTNGDGLILWEGSTTASCGTGCRGEWSVDIPFEVTSGQLGALIVWEESARDGSQTNVREHPVWLLPSVEAGGCSGADVPADLPAQPGLPAEVAATREALFEAARTCAWNTLDALIGDGPITLTFGEPPADPVAWLQQAEAQGLMPMHWLAQTLRLPTAPGRAGELEPGTAAPWVWPSAFAAESWTEVSDADRQALLEIYDQQDLAGYAEFGGFIGYRVGIDADGTWLFFVAGD